MAVLGEDFGVRICKIFDINPNLVGAIRIDLEPGNLLELNVTMRPSKSQSVSFGDIVEEMVVKARGPEDDELVNVVDYMKAMYGDVAMATDE